MCNSSSSSGPLMQFGLKMNAGQLPYFATPSQNFSMELQRAQLQDYAQRLQMGFRAFPGQVSSLNPLAYHGHLMHPYLHPYFVKDPRARFVHEEPKPNHSYIGLIAMAILSAREKKLVLSDIYQWILDNYSYFRTRGPGWRNSIRHNLSLNDCFIKAGRSANGKGHYWAIHPANLEDFQKGDFRRRRAQRRVRRHMGLTVTDDDDDDSPSPSPAPLQPSPSWIAASNNDANASIVETPRASAGQSQNEDGLHHENGQVQMNKQFRRQFDVESLLAPDPECYKRMRAGLLSFNVDDPRAIFALGQTMKNVVEENENKISSDSGNSSENCEDDSEEGKASGEENDNSDTNIHAESSGSQINVKVTEEEYISITRDSENEGSSSDSGKDTGSDHGGGNTMYTPNEEVEDKRQMQTTSRAESYLNSNESNRDESISCQIYGTNGLFRNKDFSVSQRISAFYGAHMSTLTPVSQIAKFPMISRPSVHMDIETAQKWQYSMATALIKAQSTNRHSPVSQDSD